VRLSLKYLDIMFVFSGVHMRVASENAQSAMAALSGLMPNVGGLREGRRRLLVSVVQFVLLYGAPMWAPSLVRDRRSIAVLARMQ